jgi:UDP-N-acetylglucosamine--N-acetylmuramyl-(pentapeptide) pyrophosphoryl-undecaprenol N-acetylglucosamine transferase
MLATRPPALSGWRIVHQTGSAQHAQIASFYATSGFNHLVQPFFDNMPELYAAARLTISRAGATTLAELACAGCPAILLPYPHAADNHQLANAKIFDAAGAALIAAEQQTSAETTAQLTGIMMPLLADQTRLAAMGQSMQKLARPDAARAVVTVLQSLIARPINEK